MTLDQLPVNQKANIIKVKENITISKRLLEMGLLPNTVLYIQQKAPMNGPMQIYVRGYVLTLRKSEAKLVEVEVIS